MSETDCVLRVSRFMDPPPRSITRKPKRAACPLSSEDIIAKRISRRESCCSRADDTNSWCGTVCEAKDAKENPLVETANHVCSGLHYLLKSAAYAIVDVISDAIIVVSMEPPREFDEFECDASKETDMWASQTTSTSFNFRRRNAECIAQTDLLVPNPKKKSSIVPRTQLHSLQYRAEAEVIAPKPDAQLEDNVTVRDADSVSERSTHVSHAVPARPEPVMHRSSFESACTVVQRSSVATEYPMIVKVNAPDDSTIMDGFRPDEISMTGEHLKPDGDRRSFTLAERSSVVTGQSLIIIRDTAPDGSTTWIEKRESLCTYVAERSSILTEQSMTANIDEPLFLDGQMKINVHRDSASLREVPYTLTDVDFDSVSEKTLRNMGSMRLNAVN